MQLIVFMYPTTPRKRGLPPNHAKNNVTSRVRLDEKYAARRALLKAVHQGPQFARVCGIFLQRDARLESSAPARTLSQTTNSTKGTLSQTTNSTKRTPRQATNSTKRTPSVNTNMRRGKDTNVPNRLLTFKPCQTPSAHRPATLPSAARVWWCRFADAQCSQCWLR